MQNPIDEISQALNKVFRDNEWLGEPASAGRPVPDFDVTHPKDERFGDYTTNVALIVAKKLGQNPREVASKLVTSLQNDVEMNRLIAKVEVAGAGFINFYLNEKALTDKLAKVSEEYGKNRNGEGKLAIVEYSSPNIAKPFTIGHLRSTVIGDAVANLLEANGWKVLRDNHLGDWGTQFGKQIVAIKHWGTPGKKDYTVKELVELYVRFHNEAEAQPELEDEARTWFKKLEGGDKDARQLWQMCIEASWKEFSRIYELLNVHHSQEFENGRGLGESFFEDKMGSVIELLKGKPWFKSGKEGAQLVFFPNDKYPPAMIIKKDGATLYHTRDLATDKYRKEKYDPDLIVNEVGAEQELYFQQLFEIEKMLGWYKEGQRVHVMHGMYRFKEGKMSTRKGNVIWLEEVLDEAVKRADALGKGNKKIAQEVGIGALKWNDLKGGARRDIVFDWDEVLTMKGNSGPYIQYSYARAKSVLEKAKITNQQTNKLTDQLNTEEKSILRWLYRYPEVVEQAGREYAPHIVAGYLYELASRFNSFYNKHKIVGGENEDFKVTLTNAVANVLKSGLAILGIKAPREM